MRAMAILALLVVYGLGFAVLYVLILVGSTKLVPEHGGSGVVRRILSSSLAILLLLAATAWFGRWFG